jgi:hypothetical protein
MGQVRARSPRRIWLTRSLPSRAHVKRFLPARRAVQALLAEYFELFLTTMGVLISILVTLSALSGGDQAKALTFLVWLQGFILWAVHRHCWFGRRALLRKVRTMLQDRVNSQLTVMLGAAQFRTDGASEADRRSLERATAAARRVSLELEALSFDSIRAWEQRYRASDRPTMG